LGGSDTTQPDSSANAEENEEASGSQSERGDNVPEEGAGGEAGADGTTPPVLDFNEHVQQLLAAAVRNNPEGSHPDVSALLEQAVMDMLEASGEAAAPRGAPPASKRAVAALPVVTVTAELLAALGGADTQCAVCRDELEVGVQVQVMPCSGKHVYHPDCLKPWLEKHNSCPVCRFELPTDDVEYEIKKVRLTCDTPATMRTRAPRCAHRRAAAAFRNAS